MKQGKERTSRTRDNVVEKDFLKASCVHRGWIKWGTEPCLWGEQHPWWVQGVEVELEHSHDAEANPTQQFCEEGGTLECQVWLGVLGGHTWGRVTGLANRRPLWWEQELWLGTADSRAAGMSWVKQWGMIRPGCSRRVKSWQERGPIVWPRHLNVYSGRRGRGMLKLWERRKWGSMAGMGSGAAVSRSGKWFDLEMRNYTPCRGGRERERGERERAWDSVWERQGWLQHSSKNVWQSILLRLRVQGECLWRWVGIWLWSARRWNPSRNIFRVKLVLSDVRWTECFSPFSLQGHLHDQTLNPLSML